MTEDVQGPEDLRIRVYPDAILRRRAEPVAREALGGGRSSAPSQAALTAGDIARLAAAMIRSMYDSAGVGLAAPQVGASLRLVVIDPTPERKSPLVLVNPVIVESSGREEGEEGCLSLPGIAADVNRAEKVRVEFDTLAGRREAFDAEGLPARVVQHEIDHLDGRLFIDRLGPEGRLAVRDALRELEEKAAGGK